MPIWHFIKVNHKKNLLFVVLPTKIFTDYDDEIQTKNAENKFI